jgi:hypothetical protein
MAANRFDWPLPPFAGLETMAPPPEGPQRCRIDLPAAGSEPRDGLLLIFDPDGEQLRWRADGTDEEVTLPFVQFDRLTLNVPWPLAPGAPGEPLERAPAAAQEREIAIERRGGGCLVVHSLGHVETEHGLFLFTASDDGRALLRSFVPRQAIVSFRLGQSAEEQAAERWVGTREALVAAVESQRTRSIRTLGDALLELGLVTRELLDRVLQRQGPDREAPLGEMLVAAGYLERRDLQTALAYKMGYPVVDLLRFPIDPQAARCLPRRAIHEHRVLPLMRHGHKLIVAVDDLARIPPLEELRGLADLEVVPVVAPGGRLAFVLDHLAQRIGSDLWASNVPLRHAAAADALAA